MSDTSEMVWCLCFYENDVILSAADAVQLISGLLKRFGLKPGRSSLKWKDAAKATHPRWSRMPGLAQENSDRELGYLALEEERPDAVTGSFAKCHQFAIYNGDRHSSVFSVSHRATAKGLRDILDVAQAVLPICRPRYGFVTSLAAHQSAIFYSSGIPYNASKKDDEERELQFQRARHLRFQDEAAYRELVRTKLRDAYPVNFLTDGHLARVIGNLPLDAWIAKHKHGALTEVHQGTWMWQLSNEELPAVRAALTKAGALIVSI
jgi:hypothetical protein